jgi:hypothetical protein
MRDIQEISTDVHSLLRNPKVVKTLMGVGSTFGVVVRRDNSDVVNVINLGEIPYEQREVVSADVPLGYEEETETTHEWVENLQLSFRPPSGETQVAALKGFHVFPPNQSGSSFVVNILFPEYDIGETVKLGTGDATVMEVALSMLPDFCGQVKRLIVMEFELTHVVNELVQQKTELTMGVMMFGTLLRRGVERGEDDQHLSDRQPRYQMSVEAKPFAPIAVINMFDGPVRFVRTLRWCCCAYRLFHLLVVPHVRFHENPRR